MKIFSYIVILLLIILGITFAILNAEMVTVHYYVGVHQAPLSLILVLTFGLGLLVGMIFMGFAILRLKAGNYRLKKRLDNAEREIQNLREIPVKDDH